jgi:D-alanyl-D-alanine carboxypeptidase
MHFSIENSIFGRCAAMRLTSPSRRCTFEVEGTALRDAGLCRFSEEVLVVKTRSALGVAGVLLMIGAVPGVAQARPSADTSAVRASLRTELNRYLNTRRTAEHISAVSLAVAFRGRRPSINLAVGSTRYRGGRPISLNNLWQIGSNTKAFTAVMVLQLEAERKLSINDRLGKWLPQYPAWRRITIKQLLNMTSGIQDVFAQPAFLRTYAAAPNQVFSGKRLVEYVVRLPRKTGWLYSNVNYVLAQMIIERATNDSYADQLRRRIVIPLGLHNLFFSATRYPRSVVARLPAGYYYIPPEAMPELSSQFAKDQSRYPVVAPPSGGIASSPGDLAKWDRALFTGRELPRKQQRELESLVSEKTGKPIKKTTAADPGGFGLGITQTTDPALGTVWAYLGSTLGFRFLLIYLPRSGSSIAIGVNSLPDQDQLALLAPSVYRILHRAGLS